MSSPDSDDALNEVPVHPAVLRATAHLMELLSDFFTTDPAIQISLGTFLIDHHGAHATTDPIAEAVIMVSDLSDAAELLHALAGDYNTGTAPDQQ